MAQANPSSPADDITPIPAPKQSTELLLRIKPCKMLIFLKDNSQPWYPSKLAKASGSTYVHTTKLLSKFQKSDLVKFETKGRTKSVILTEKGVLVAKLLEDLVEKMAPAPTSLPAQPPASAEEKKPADDHAIV